MDRRTFLRGVGAAPLLGAARALGASDRIAVGLIGCGGMGRGDLATFFRAEKIDCPVVCDVDRGHLAALGRIVEQRAGRSPQQATDFREVLDRRDVDAVVIATPDHWHALPAVKACQAGKDLYLEKPMATTVRECEIVVRAARANRRVLQMGTQWRSSRHWGEAVRFVRSGKLGRIRQVRAWAYLTWPKTAGNAPDGPPPPEVDYDFWLGPAPKRPFNPGRFHFTWRWFWDYGGGLQTDWGVHLFNIAIWAMGDPMPRAVSSGGGKYVLRDISDTPDTQVSVLEYDDFVLVWEHQILGGHGPESREHGVAFHGVNGTLIVDNGGWEVVPEGKKMEAVPRRKSPGDDSRLRHVRNFLACMRTREDPVECPEVAFRASVTPALGNVAFLTGRKIRWDAERKTVVGDEEAARRLTRRYRSPWTLPGL